MTGRPVNLRLDCIEHSLELIAERDLDILPLVYRRLFAGGPSAAA